ncbi:atrophin-1-like [Pyrus ussuriensis x Pyrus communis]|uniref:Atrophin-1-like n=1 Tax=Pyrus ussuriensis x Pyrus communis TaxID=2448454 RepID=A0A5N5F2L8_9ROSA|nr:atrophin-1-like [Pyrus ussuriensis x Pyrus communis]
MMVAAKMKLADPLKRVATISPHSAELTPMMTLAAPTMSSKRPCPEVEMTGNIARPQKHIKKKAKKGQLEIHVISCRITKTTTSSFILSSPIVQASKGVPQNPLSDQTTEVRPTI